MSTSKEISTGGWVCPQCSRRVPRKIPACRCGHRRGQTPVTHPGGQRAPQTLSQGRAQSPQTPRRSQWTWIGWTVAASLLVILALAQLNKKEPPPQTTGQPQETTIAKPEPISNGSFGESSQEVVLLKQGPSTTMAPTASFEDTIGKALPAIVSVETSNGRGSGFFVERDLIVTNYHVVIGEPHPKVKLHSGESISSTTIRVSENHDLALLATDNILFDQPFLQLGNDSDVRVGQEVIAIGLALGILESTVTRGIVSAIRGTDQLTLIQTDAAINPGNSGGPLIDRNGNVIGITTLKLTGGGSESLGFAVAIRHAKFLQEGGGTEPPTHVAVLTEAAPQAVGQMPEKSTRQLMREEGTRIYVEAVRRLAQSADNVDSYWERYKSYCEGQTTVGVAYGRDWFGYWDAPVTINNESLPECRALWDDIARLSEEIRLGMQGAESRAHTAGVYPGDRRTIRRRYGMDWKGWDR